MHIQTALIAAAVLAIAPTVAPSTEDLYTSAVTQLASIPQHPYVSYAMEYTNTHKGKDVGEATLSVVERRADRRSWNKTMASKLGLWGNPGTVSIGRHYLIPDAFLPYRHERAPSGVLPAFDAPQLHTIATVHSALSYAVTLVRDETLDGCGPAAHLALRPLRDPQRYNVREMWVRRFDFRLCKAVFASRLYQDENKRGSLPMIVTAELDGNGMITRFSGFVQEHLLLATYAATTVGTFSDVTWAGEEPPYLFDDAAWKASGGANPVPTPKRQVQPAL